MQIAHVPLIVVPAPPNYFGFDTPDNDGWIEWKGGECPVPKDATVQVEYRGYSNSSIQSNHSAGILEWNHLGIHDDIIKYRVVK
jgi:hypothetical protein